MTNEKLLPVEQAIHLVTGRRVGRTTAYRWRTRGYQGAILQTWRMGKLRLTTETAVRNFLRAMNAGDLMGGGQ